MNTGDARLMERSYTYLAIKLVGRTQHKLTGDAIDYLDWYFSKVDFWALT